MADLLCIALSLNVIVFVPMAAIVGHTMRGRAREGAGLGFLFGPIGLGIVLALDDFRRRCPACQRTVPNYQATMCGSCRTPLPPTERPSSHSQLAASIGAGVLVGGAVIVLGEMVVISADQNGEAPWVLPARLGTVAVAMLIGVLAGWARSRNRDDPRQQPPTLRRPPPQ